MGSEEEEMSWKEAEQVEEKGSEDWWKGGKEKNIWVREDCRNWKETGGDAERSGRERETGE